MTGPVITPVEEIAQTAYRVQRGMQTHMWRVLVVLVAANTVFGLVLGLWVLDTMRDLVRDQRAETVYNRELAELRAAEMKQLIAQVEGLQVSQLALVAEVAEVETRQHVTTQETLEGIGGQIATLPTVTATPAPGPGARNVTVPAPVTPAAPAPTPTRPPAPQPTATASSTPAPVPAPTPGPQRPGLRKGQRR